MTVRVWDKQAQACCEFLQKGSPIFVEGVLQSRSWETPDGQKRSTIDVRAERIQFLGKFAAENKQIDKMDAIGSSAEGQVENSTASSDEPLGETINPMDVSWDES